MAEYMRCKECLHYRVCREWAAECGDEKFPYSGTDICDFYMPAASDNIKINLFDKEEIHKNCTVQVLTNTVTGDVSVGWWENERSEDDG